MVGKWGTFESYIGKRKVNNVYATMSFARPPVPRAVAENDCRYPPVDIVLYVLQFCRLRTALRTLAALPIPGLAEEAAPLLRRLFRPASTVQVSTALHEVMVANDCALAGVVGRLGVLDRVPHTWHIDVTEATALHFRPPPTLATAVMAAERGFVRLLQYVDNCRDEQWGRRDAAALLQRALENGHGCIVAYMADAGHSLALLSEAGPPVPTTWDGAARLTAQRLQQATPAAVRAVAQRLLRQRLEEGDATTTTTTLTTADWVEAERLARACLVYGCDV